MSEKKSEKQEPASRKFFKDPNAIKIKKDHDQNPFEKYQRTLKTSLGTLLLGVIMAMIGLVWLGYSEGINEDVNYIRRLPLIQAENLTKTAGMVKITGTPVMHCYEDGVDCDDEYIHSKLVHESLVEGKWVKIKVEENWGNFSLGEVVVHPGRANMIYDYETVSSQEDDGRRVTLYGVPASDDIIVVGLLENQTIREGNLFIVSNMNNRDLVDYFYAGRRVRWWSYKLLSVFLISIGLLAFLFPILSFLDIFPSLGILPSLIIYSMLLIFAILVVLLTTIVITFWWMIVVLVGMLIILLIRIRMRSDKYPINIIP